ncbi:hypothetical protein H1V43_40140, partial [Streptomyces sp. PSKA54]
MQKLIPEWEIKKIVRFVEAGRTGVEAQLLLTNGLDVNKPFDAARVVTRFTSVIPGTQLFGTIGTPAVYCLQAAWWLNQELGIKTGEWLKEAIKVKQAPAEPPQVPRDP